MSLVRPVERVPDFLKDYAKANCPKATLSDDWPEMYEVSLDDLEDCRKMLRLSLVMNEWMLDDFKKSITHWNWSSEKTPAGFKEEIDEALQYLDLTIAHPDTLPLLIRPRTGVPRK
jgi:hypothetical protein